jgi:hypothetical protein
VVGITKTITLHFGCLLRLVRVVGITKTLTVPFGCLLRLLLVYTDHTYNNLKNQPKGTVIFFAIPTTLTIVLINNQKVLLVS